MNWIIENAILIGHRLLDQIMMPTSRTYIPFLFTALLLANYISWTERKQLLRANQRLFSRATWMSASARHDYMLIVINFLFISIIQPVIYPNYAAIYDAVNNQLSNIAPMANESELWVTVIFALTLFVVDDFVRYLLHYAEHRIPVMWELHKVHHSAPSMNFMTAERHHPLSVVFFQIPIATAALSVNLLFLIMFKEKLSVAGMLGGNIFWVISNFAGGALRHSPVWLSFGAKFERWFISPAQHQIHHSDDPKHFDRNFGGTLAVWDRMFGTLYVTNSKRENIKYGLGSETKEYSSLWKLILRPLQKIIIAKQPSVSENL
jgi:sterol desaturase/sphingolipid hydroxylase (fatty acid hydroxylase superfamily)